MRISKLCTSYTQGFASSMVRCLGLVDLLMIRCVRSDQNRASSRFIILSSNSFLLRKFVAADLKDLFEGILEKNPNKRLTMDKIMVFKRNY